MKLLRNLLPLFFLLISINLQTQELPKYTIQIGTFVKPNPNKFENLRSLGFIYAKSRGDNLYDVRMGGYASLSAAEAVAETIKSTTNENAIVLPLNIEAGQPAAVIQLAIKQGNKPFDWTPYSEMENLYVLIENGVVKILTGIYENDNVARQQLGDIRSKGFSGAFPKLVNNVLLHKIGAFEMGGKKQPLIPLEFGQELAKKEGIELPKKETQTEQPPVSEELKEDKDAPIKFVQEEAPPKETVTKKSPPKSKFTAQVPTIRGKIKRTSALRLQEALKADGTYKSSLDGYYGGGTQTAFKASKNTNRQIQKYQILAKYQSSPNTEAGNELQQAINKLWETSANSIGTLKKSISPLAKAYRAYYLFEAEGMDNRVNDLMNSAIKEAFKDTKVTNLPKFDYSATYAYNDINQLLMHLRYIHEASNISLSVPCWMFDKHETAAQKAFSNANNIAIQNCGGFWEWEEIQVLTTMARDLSLDGSFGKTASNKNQSKLTRLFITPKTISANKAKELQEWEKKLWLGIEGWSMRAPMLEQISAALKIEFYHNYVLLEDYYMNQNFKDKEAKHLALATLKTLVGEHLKRFI